MLYVDKNRRWNIETAVYSHRPKITAHLASQDFTNIHLELIHKAKLKY